MENGNKSRSRLEFVGMALALHLLFGRKVREIALMAKQYAMQFFSFGIHYLQKPWLLFSRTYLHTHTFSPKKDSFSCRMVVCVYVRTYTHTYTHTEREREREMRDYLCTDMGVHVHVFVCVCIYARVCAFVCAVLITILFALLTTTALPYMESAADRERQRLKKEMNKARSYTEWRALAMKYERIESSLKDKHGDTRASEDMGYDEELIESRVEHLQRIREKGSIRDIMFHLRTDLLRNLGNMTSLRLESSTSVELPQPIEEYLAEVTKQLEMITSREAAPDSSTEEKLTFLQETRHAFGRTALVLSGGGSFGTFHLGLIKTLIEHNLVPRVLAGSSVGAIACAFIATRSPSDVMEIFSDLDEKPERMGFYSGTSMRQLFGHYVVNGSLHSGDILQRRLRSELGDVTFQEAFDISGKILCITVSPTRKNESPRLLSYLTSPHVLVWSAVSASCAFPGLFPAQKLYAKDLSGNVVVYHGECVSIEAPSTTTTLSTMDDDDAGSKTGAGAVGAQKKHKETRHWRDGSLEDDLPLRRLSELFNANYFIVSQVNPHIIPFLHAKQKLRSCGRVFGGMASLMESEVKHRVGQLREILGERGRSLSLLTQSWEGDVTIVMPATMKQYQGLIFNPTKSEYSFAFRQGQINTWPKLHIIDANMRIEKCLDDCVSRLRSTKSRFQPGGRVPSWNTLCVVDNTSTNSSNSTSPPSRRLSPPLSVFGERSRMMIEEGNESSGSDTSAGSCGVVDGSTEARSNGEEEESVALSKAADEVLTLCAHRNRMDENRERKYVEDMLERNMKHETKASLRDAFRSRLL